MAALKSSELISPCISLALLSGLFSFFFPRIFALEIKEQKKLVLQDLGLFLILVFPRQILFLNYKDF